ncbi:hypothetical protein PC110_g12993 [Phytophthora cactorum]|uniref:PiggyBac transposable element-derived protein domain-containing protein n=1 Tax=Phytophthora cactorum TaxID=29920 RepID=A0A329S442_9STRA|nr:hypothetical protein C6341_g26127 [Phytophthora cactorum]RAW30646.1 hypothetical protein PC110_g12993 [Phytophthora cactorum]
MFKKYYKMFFLGLVDMALANAYIVHREDQKSRGEPVMRHSEFLAMLQAQLLDFTADDFKRGTSSPGPGTPHEARTADQHCHELVECPEFQTIGGVQRRARSSV